LTIVPPSSHLQDDGTAALDMGGDGQSSSAASTKDKESTSDE
jgi:hypothetical protein